jgi:6-phosphogluconolactonase (cycloisomerase 2 family)
MKYRNPVGIVTSPDSKNLYVIYRDDNAIQQYGIGHDGKIYPLNTYNTPGAFPVSVAINAAGTYLYVVDTYQPGYSDTSPGPGALIAYPIKSDGSLGSAVTNGTKQYYPVGMIPNTSSDVVTTLVSVSSSSKTVLVSSLTASGSNGALYAYSVASDGTLSALGSGNLGSSDPNAGAGIYSAGTRPSAVAMDLTGAFAYVTDASENKLRVYSIASGLSPMDSMTMPTGNKPSGLTVDPRNEYLYVANNSDGSLSGFKINSTTGSLTSLAAGTVASTGTQPTCVFIEPRFGHYVYVTNFLSNSVSGFQMNPSDGSLFSIQKAPFGAALQPTCGAAIAHGTISLTSN